MAAMSCESLIYVCRTPSSSTVFEVPFYERLWQTIIEESVRGLSTRKHISKPKKKIPILNDLKQKLKLYKGSHVHFSCEIPSLIASPCSHDMTVVNDLSNVHCMHTSTYWPVEHGFLTKYDRTSLPCVRKDFLKVDRCLEAMYEIQRLPAKEVLVAIISDMDRIKEAEQVHAMPISYGLSGYSLHGSTLRIFFTELVEVCFAKWLTVRALSADGQF